MKLYYCKKCGRIMIITIPGESQVCDLCFSKLYKVPDELLIGETKTCFASDEVKQDFIDTQIKTSKEFDYHLFELMNKRLEEQRKRFDGEVLKVKNNLSSIPKCPTCQSTNIRRIDSAERGFSFALCGFFSNKINKSFECLNCGYTW